MSVYRDVELDKGDGVVISEVKEGLKAEAVVPGEELVDG